MRNLDVHVGMDVFFLNSLIFTRALKFSRFYMFDVVGNNIIDFFKYSTSFHTSKAEIEELMPTNILIYQLMTIDLIQYSFSLVKQMQYCYYTSFLTIQHSRRIFSATHTSGSMKESHYMLYVES
jgi:hypothetical protein